MRINDPTITSAGVSVTTTKGTGATASVTSGSSTSRSGAAGYQDDSVQLSSLAAGLESLRSDSAARLEKVERLGQVVAAGQYQTDAQTIASSLVTEALGG